MLKDLVYLGLGGAMLAKERVEEELQNLVEKGKLSKDDASKLISKAKERGKEEEERVKKELRDTLKEVMKELNLATKDDIEDLKKLINSEK